MVDGYPVKEKILNNLQSLGDDGSAADPATGLGLIDGTGTPADWYTTVEKITRIDGSPIDLDNFPAIIIIPVSADYDPEGTQGTTTIAAKYRVQLTLLIRTRDEAVQKIERFIRDAHKAILVDRTRGSNAIWTRALADEVHYPTDDDEPFTTANLLIEMLYRTEIGNLNQPT